MTMNLSHPLVYKAKRIEREWGSCRKRRLQELWQRMLPEGGRSIGKEESTSVSHRDREDSRVPLHLKWRHGVVLRGRKEGGWISIWQNEERASDYALRRSVCRKRGQSMNRLRLHDHIEVHWSQKRIQWRRPVEEEEGGRSMSYV